MKIMSDDMAKRWIEVTARIMHHTDMVEVVRCVKCRHYSAGWCNKRRVNTTQMGFCDKGVKNDETGRQS